MKTNRRDFLELAGAAGAGLIAVGRNPANDKVAPRTDSPTDAGAAAFMTELFLDNHLIEVTPGVSRRLHKPKKHLLNPIVRCDRWCDGNNIQPFHDVRQGGQALQDVGTDWQR